MAEQHETRDELLATDCRSGSEAKMKPRLTGDEREIILENLIHDLAGLDTTTEEEAGQLYDKLVAEGRIDPAMTSEAHRRLLVRLGVKPGLESPQALATGDLLRAYEAHRGVSREEIARELGVDLQTLARIEADSTPVPAADPEFAEAGRRLAERVRGTAARIVSALRLGRMKLLESVADPTAVYARKEKPKEP